MKRWENTKPTANRCLSVALRKLFEPQAIAVVGASQTEGKIGYEAMANTVQYDKPVYPVNPSTEGKLFGEPFVESVTEIDDTVDLALCCVPASVIPDVLKECGEAGVRGAVIYAGGFAEAGNDGEALQDAAIEVADKYGISLLGPNTSGFVVPGIGLMASFTSGVEYLKPGNVAVVAQSGGVAHSLAFGAAREGRGLSAMVGLGNRANTDFAEVIGYFDDHDVTEAIVLHVEGTDDGRALLRACRSSKTPVVVYKVGKEDVGEFAESHTGALTGDHDLYQGGFRQYGIPSVESTTELLDVGQALASSPTPTGPNVGVVTAQAGPGIIIADRLKGAGAALPSLEESTQETIDEILPGITYAANPVDTGRPMPEFGEVIEAVANDQNVDVVLVYELHEEALGYPVDKVDGLAEAAGKPVLFATDGPNESVASDLDTLRNVGVPTFPSPERGADVAAALAQYGADRQALDSMNVNAAEEREQ